ncbi:hypothetical protein F2P81_014569 [Scophthalmus maximus]|uniref:Uncharacterized protein n=1 Tax=Scophthalmus maximus TaxID=52904 RepID=A0A6A4SID7_SCOMX|nr:hypothetical protein F2P81_014569 [Scophthalmus maximus]
MAHSIGRCYMSRHENSTKKRNRPVPPKLTIFPPASAVHVRTQRSRGARAASPLVTFSVRGNFGDGHENLKINDVCVRSVGFLRRLIR